MQTVNDKKLTPSPLAASRGFLVAADGTAVAFNLTRARREFENTALLRNLEWPAKRTATPYDAPLLAALKDPTKLRAYAEANPAQATEMLTLGEEYLVPQASAAGARALLDGYEGNPEAAVGLWSQAGLLHSPAAQLMRARAARRIVESFAAVQPTAQWQHLRADPPQHDACLRDCVAAMLRCHRDTRQTAVEFCRQYQPMLEYLCAELEADPVLWSLPWPTIAAARNNGMAPIATWLQEIIPADTSAAAMLPPCDARGAEPPAAAPAQCSYRDGQDTIRTLSALAPNRTRQTALLAKDGYHPFARCAEAGSVESLNALLEYLPAELYPDMLRAVDHRVFTFALLSGNPAMIDRVWSLAGGDAALQTAMLRYSEERPFRGLAYIACRATSPINVDVLLQILNLAESDALRREMLGPNVLLYSSTLGGRALSQAAVCDYPAAIDRLAAMMVPAEDAALQTQLPSLLIGCAERGSIATFLSLWKLLTAQAAAAFLSNRLTPLTPQQQTGLPALMRLMKTTDKTALTMFLRIFHSRQAAAKTPMADVMRTVSHALEARERRPIQALVRIIPSAQHPEFFEAFRPDITKMAAGGDVGFALWFLSLRGPAPTAESPDESSPAP